MNNKNFSLSLVTLALSITATDINAADAYNLVEIEVTENYKHHYPEAMNSQGEIIGNAFTRYNPVIYPESYLASLGIPQEEIDANTYTNTSMNTIRNALLLGSGSLANDALVQKIADARGFVSNLASSSDDKAVLVNTVDVIDEEIDSFTFSSLEQLTGINDSGVIVGNATAPFTTSMFTAEGSEEEVKVWTRAYSSRATVTIDGVTTVIEPTLAEFGGRSAAFGISDSGFIAGSESTTFVGTAEEDLPANCTGETAPVEFCTYDYQLRNTTYLDTPVIWQIDAAGNVIDKVQYPLSFQVDADDTMIYSSSVKAVNDNGVGVGLGVVPSDVGGGFTSQRAIVFRNGESEQIPMALGEFDTSDAIAINNSGLVIGHHNEFFNARYNSKYFVYDISSGTLTYPETFFKSAQSFAGAVNNDGVVVGSAEYETSSSSTKRRHAFIYDTTTELFRDLNDLVECQSDFEVVSAQDINDEGQILATAVKTVQARNSIGELLYSQEVVYETDADGNIIEGTGTTEYVLDENGEKIPVMDAVIVPVRLDPIDSISESSCGVSEPYERKGFSFGWLSAMLGLGLVAIRRRFL